MKGNQIVKQLDPLVAAEAATTPAEARTHFDHAMIELRRPVERPSIRDLAVAAYERHLTKQREAWITKWIKDGEWEYDEGYERPTTPAQRRRSLLAIGEPGQRRPDAVGPPGTR
jgi:hypothetical protein